MSRITLFLAGAIAFASQPCMPEGTLDPKDDTADSAPGDTHASTQGPCESGFCDLTVTDAVVQCGEGITGDPSALELITASAGTVSIHHHRVEQGCCPELAVTALQDLRNDRIEVEYDLYDDMCDCICELDVLYTLSDLYAGTFDLTAAGDSLSVTVE